MIKRREREREIKVVVKITKERYAGQIREEYKSLGHYVHYLEYKVPCVEGGNYGEKKEFIFLSFFLFS